MPRRGFLENQGYLNVWDPGTLATGSKYVATANRWYQWAVASNLLIFFRTVTGAVQAKLSHEYSLDGVSYTLIKESALWVPETGIYSARIHRDLLPAAVAGDLGLSATPRGALCRWALTLAAGTEVSQGAFEIWEQMKENPSRGQPQDVGSRQSGHHYNQFDSARLQQDSNGVDRLRFDFSPGADES
jgi:hypothetical protein